MAFGQLGQQHPAAIALHQVGADHLVDPVVGALDMDSPESPTCGNQEGGGYPERDRNLGLRLGFVTKQSLADRRGTECAGTGIPRSG